MPLIRESAELNRRERDKIEYLTPGSPVNYSLLSAGIIAGDTIKVINGGTATVTVLSSNAATVASLLPGTDATFVALVSSPTTPANFKAILTSMDPTVLFDAAATRMGLKTYSHGTTYNGGNAPTVSANNVQPGFTCTDSHFIPYMTQGGTWRVKFNIRISLTTSQYTATLVNGMTPAYSQAISVSATDGTLGAFENLPYAFNQSGNTAMANRLNASVANFAISGDIALASKPTWAY
jgi:hypothetical protein